MEPIIMATVRLAATSLLTTLSETANTVTDIVSSVRTGAQMLNDFTSNARDNQRMNIKLSAVGYEQNLRADKALEIVKSQGRLDDYINGDTAKADRIAAIMLKFDEVLA